MKEKKTPVVSIITLVVMIVFVILTISEYYSGIHLYGCWAICVAALFLSECLCGRIKKRFASNIGVFAVDAIIAAVYIVLLLQSFGDHEGGIGRAFLGLFFLPPVIVSLVVNIGNIIYKL